MSRVALFLTVTILLLPACSSPAVVTYTADHVEGLDVEVTYRDADGAEITEVVSTPWTFTTEGSEPVEARLEVLNVGARAAVSCQIDVDDFPHVDASGGGLARCETSVSSQGSSGTSINSSTFGTPLLLSASGALFTDLPPAESVLLGDPARWRAAPGHLTIADDEGHVVSVDLRSGAVSERTLAGIPVDTVLPDTDGNLWITSCLEGSLSVAAPDEDPVVVLDLVDLCPRGLWVIGDLVFAQLDAVGELLVLDRATEQERGRIEVAPGLQIEVVDIGGDVFVSVLGEPTLFALDTEVPTATRSVELTYDVRGSQPLDGTRRLLTTSEGIAVFDGEQETGVLPFDGVQIALGVDGERFYAAVDDVVQEIDTGTLEVVAEVAPLEGDLVGATASELLFLHAADTDDTPFVLRRLPLTIFD